MGGCLLSCEARYRKDVVTLMFWHTEWGFSTYCEARYRKDNVTLIVCSGIQKGWWVGFKRLAKCVVGKMLSRGRCCSW